MKHLGTQYCWAQRQASGQTQIVMIQSNKRPFQNSKLHINSHVFWICIQASMTLRAGSSVLSQNCAPTPPTPTPTPSHQPPTEYWRHRLLYLSLNLPVPATNNIAPSNVFATNADCTSDWLYQLFATSADCTSDYLLPATAPLVLHQPPRTNLFVTTGSSTGHRAAMQLNHARLCHYILIQHILFSRIQKKLWVMLEICHCQVHIENIRLWQLCSCYMYFVFSILCTFCMSWLSVVSSHGRQLQQQRTPLWPREEVRGVGFSHLDGGGLGGGGLYVVQVINTNIDACINVNININIIISLHVDFNQILTFVARESSHARHKYNEAKLIIIIITLLQNLYIYDHGTIIVADIESQFKLLRICS